MGDLTPDSPYSAHSPIKFALDTKAVRKYQDTALVAIDSLMQQPTVGGVKVLLPHPFNMN